MSLLDHAQELQEALRGVEWSGVIWTDTAVCLFCGRHKDGANLVNPVEVYPPRTHEADCEWVRLTSVDLKSVVEKGQP